MPSSNRKLLENLSFQSIAEFAGKGLQAVYTIYLANVLGAEGYGIYGFATSIVSYFILFVSFGMDVYGSREVATDKDSVESNVNHIFSLRLLLAIIAYSVLIAIVYLFIEDTIVQFAIILIGINIFSNAILLNWVFQGLERMGIIAVRTILVSVLNLVLIFIYVNSPDDTLLAFGILSFSMLLNSIIMTIYYLKKIGKIKLSYSAENWKRIAKGSIPIGLFAVMVSIMNNIDLSLIGALLTDFKYEAGIYNAAYKIVFFAIVPSIIIQNAFFPQLSRAESVEDRNRLFSKYSKAIHVVGAITAFVTFFYSDFLITSLLNTEFQGSIKLMNLFAVSIFIVFINISLASSLVAWKMEKLVIYATIYAVIMNIIIDLILIPIYGAYGATVATILAELTLLIALSYNLYKATNKVYITNIFIVFLIGIISIMPSLLYINDNIGNIVGIISTVLLFVLITHFSGFFRILDIKKILRT